MEETNQPPQPIEEVIETIKSNETIILVLVLLLLFLAFIGGIYYLYIYHVENAELRENITNLSIELNQSYQNGFQNASGIILQNICRDIRYNQAKNVNETCAYMFDNNITFTEGIGWHKA